MPKIKQKTSVPSSVRHKMHNTERQIRAVLFDLGETLITFGRIRPAKLYRQSAESSYEYLKNLSQPVRSFTYYYLKSLIYFRYNHLMSNLLGNDFDSLKLLKKIGSKHNIKLDEQQWLRLAWLWYEPLAKIGKAEPDIRNTLTALKNLDLKLGILSNTFIHKSCLERHLEQAGILDFFPVRFYSYEFDFKKPDSRIFETAAEKIGEKTENILFVGDHIKNDINPALKAGMYAALKTAYTNTGKITPQGAQRIDRLSELPPIIARINDSG